MNVNTVKEKMLVYTPILDSLRYEALYVNEKYMTDITEQQSDSIKESMSDDLIQDSPKGEKIKETPDGSIIVTLYKGKFILLKQFSHSMRKETLCFPQKPDLTPEADDAANELCEELGVKNFNLRFLGNVVDDSGVCGNKVAIYYAKLKEKSCLKRTEGDTQIIEMDEEELRKSDITDGLTLSAIDLYKKYKRDENIKIRKKNIDKNIKNKEKQIKHNRNKGLSLLNFVNKRDNLVLCLTLNQIADTNFFASMDSAEYKALYNLINNEKLVVSTFKNKDTNKDFDIISYFEDRIIKTLNALASGDSKATFITSKFLITDKNTTTLSKPDIEQLLGYNFVLKSQENGIPLIQTEIKGKNKKSVPFSITYYLEVCEGVGEESSPAEEFVNLCSSEVRKKSKLYYFFKYKKLLKEGKDEEKENLKRSFEDKEFVGWVECIFKLNELLAKKAAFISNKTIFEDIKKEKNLETIMNCMMENKELFRKKLKEKSYQQLTDNIYNNLKETEEQLKELKGNRSQMFQEIDKWENKKGGANKTKQKQISKEIVSECYNVFNAFLACGYIRNQYQTSINGIIAVPQCKILDIVDEKYVIRTYDINGDKLVEIEDIVIGKIE